jgi:hypothetical protein
MDELIEAMEKDGYKISTEEDLFAVITEKRNPAP